MVLVSFSLVSIACQLLARGHCALPAMHTNSLTKPRPHGLPPSQECQFHLPSFLSSFLPTPTPFPFLYLCSCFIHKTHMVIRKTHMDDIHSWNPTKAMQYHRIRHSLLLLVFLYCIANRGLSSLFSRTQTHTDTPPPHSYMNDLGACTLTICHLPWALLRPT